MTFEDLFIPKGTNARFENCTFVGTTYVETEVECDDPNWNYLGAVERIDDGSGGFSYELKFPGIAEATIPDGSGSIPDTKEWSNNLVFEGCTILGAIAGDRPAEYTHWRNKLQFTGATRFYLDPLDPEIQIQPDSAAIISTLGSFSEEQADIRYLLKFIIHHLGGNVKPDENSIQSLSVVLQQSLEQARQVNTPHLLRCL